MLGLTEWMKTVSFPDRPWLILGKGPSFARRGEFDLSGYNTLSLNHVVREVQVDVAHMIDVDVVEACGSRVLENCGWLLMPRRPHAGFKPGPDRLEDYFKVSPTLREMDARGRLVWYNLTADWYDPAHRVGEPGSPPIEVKYFSSEAAVRLLGTMGTKVIRTLGVDGGRNYSATFGDLTTQTKLANGQPSFDLQFAEIQKAVRAHGLDYAPLVEPMRVFVGVDDSQRVAAQVLHHSICKYASGPVEFNLMDGARMPIPKDPANRPRTGFSFCRFMIPQLCGYKGRAVYLDADMQVFADLAELWKIPFDDQKVLCTFQADRPDQWKDDKWFHPGRQMSVMLLDCARLDWDVEKIVRDMDAGGFDYKQLMFDLCVVAPGEIADRIPPAWNCLEHYQPASSKLVHYTVVPTQPWKNDDNPLRGVWEAGYREAVADAAVSVADVQQGVRAGHLKPSLLEVIPAHLRTPEPVAKRRSLIRKVAGRILRPLRKLTARFAGRTR